MKQVCYPRTFHEDLAKDIFRLYDRDGNGSIMFEVTFKHYVVLSQRTFQWNIFQEFLMMIYVMSSGSKEEKLEQIFR